MAVAIYALAGERSHRYFEIYKLDEESGGEIWE